MRRRIHDTHDERRVECSACAPCVILCTRERKRELMRRRIHGHACAPCVILCTRPRSCRFPCVLCHSNRFTCMLCLLLSSAFPPSLPSPPLSLPPLSPFPPSLPSSLSLFCFSLSLVFLLPASLSLSLSLFSFSLSLPLLSLPLSLPLSLSLPPCLSPSLLRLPCCSIGVYVLCDGWAMIEKVDS